MKRRTLVLVLVVAAVVVVAGVAVYVLTRPLPIPLTISDGSTTGAIEGNLSTSNSIQPLGFEYTATTYANQTSGTASWLTLRLFAYTYSTRAGGGPVVVNINATVDGRFASNLHPTGLQVTTNQSGPNAVVYYGAFLWGRNVSFSSTQYSYFVNNGSGAATAAISAASFRFSDPVEADVSPQPSRFLGFKATVTGPFTPAVSVGIVLAVIDVPASIHASVGKSADGTNWIVNVTSVSRGLSNMSAYLSVTGGGGMIVQPAPLGMLYYSDISAIAYLPATPGSGLMNPGDRILLAIATYPAGDQVQLSVGGGILFSAPLQ